MSRGGKRSGAGRKPAVADSEWVALIRRDYEQRAHGYRLLQGEKRLDRKLAKLPKGGIHWNEEGVGNPLMQVPLQYRPFVVERQEHLREQFPTEYGVVVVNRRGVEKQGPLPAEIPEEVRYAIEFMRHNAEVRDKTKSSPLLCDLPRLYRRRQEIINQMAIDYSLSRRTVRTILESGKADSDV